jgi:hypothetical protein
MRATVSWLSASAAVFALSITLACSEEKEPPSTEYLIGTSWKLVAFVNSADGTSKTPEQNSPRSYLLTFYSNNKLSGKTLANAIVGSYETDPQSFTIQIKAQYATEVFEFSPYPELFIDGLNSSHHYSITQDTLKLYYSENDYLLFSNYEEESPKVPENEISFTEYSLTGTSCQWANLGYDSTLIIINNQNDLEKYITSSKGTPPDIDFERQTLLLASGITLTGIHALSKTISKTIDMYTLKIDILLNEALVVEKWVVALIVDHKSNPGIDKNIAISGIDQSGGADNTLIYPAPSSDLDQKRTDEILKKSSAYVAVYFVKIDLNKISFYNQFVLQFGENTVVVNKRNLEQQGTRSFCFSAESEYIHNTIMFCVLGDNILGTIHTSNKLYRIDTIDENIYAVIQVDQSKLPED